MSADFDDILEALGTGKWNFIYFFGLCMINFLDPGLVFTGAFVTPSVNFTCSNQEPEADLIQDQDECKYIVWDNSTSENTTKTLECTEWTYTDEHFSNTMTSEFDLVCNDAYLRPTYQTVLMFGNLVGAPMNGFLSDRFGRKRLISFTVAIKAVTVLLQSFMYNFNIILAIQFLSGCTSAAVHHSSYILCMEVCPPKHRSTVGILTSVPWALGMVWWGVVGYLIREWRWLLRADVAPVVVIVAWLWVIDESPRWLIVKGHHGKVVKSLRRAAHRNNVSLFSDEELLKQAGEIEQSLKTDLQVEENDQTLLKKFQRGLAQIIVLYRTPEIRKRILLLYCAYFVNNTVYIGLTLNAVNYQLDPFMYMVVTGLSEVPAYTLTIPIVAKFGRVRPAVAFYIGCGITILALAFVSPSDPKWLIITLAMVGKFCISASFLMILLLSCELVPTEVRLQCIGTSSFVASVGGMAAPYITDILSYHKWVPSVIFGGLGILAGISSSFLPETLNTHMFETIQQLEADAERKKNKHKKNEMEALQNDSKATETETA